MAHEEDATSDTITQEIIFGDRMCPVKALPLPEGYKGAVYLNPNIEISGHSNDDVVACASGSRAALLIVFDGISTGKPGKPTYGFESGPVAKYAAEIGLAYAKAHLAAGRAFSLQEMHRHIGEAVKTAFIQNTLPKGGLVGVSALLLPNGVIHVHRFGDAEIALSGVNGGRFWVPNELLPQNMALRRYQEDGDISIDQVLIPERKGAPITNFILTSRGLSNPEGPDWIHRLAAGQRFIMGSDGLMIYDQLKALHETKGDAQQLLSEVANHANRFSTDNISGFAIQRIAA
ncbi:hypothetical protein IPG41_01625 [Candidatus Peregrinibacteria bacterium]|nr:MAG: hypothetical protein IPG41_01625 [Candidatus Peregrinibacteria bacterium]